MRLGKFVLKTMSASAPYICDIRCKQEITSQSYSYNRKEEICKLSNRTKEARPENFRSAPSWFYIMRLNGRAPLGSILQLPALSCQEIKASEGKDAITNKYWLNLTGSGKTQLMYCDLNFRAVGAEPSISIVVELYEVERRSLCSNSPCFNNGTCQAGYTDKRFRCKCPLGFTAVYYKKARSFDFEDGNGEWEKTGRAFIHQPTFGDNPVARHRETAQLQGDW
ncbi:hypothetical protein AWC38_SpisGene16931 [Stylophora pistillata]|uniref:EGF-like domain-containing protein n=1 Tax=Stylophora pistillata TaxID=50429 RepID=A0A2B4RPG1_STYPI|nr:hypothetical protein AWC38_SpisGene16931 [Stylophora pistillata]